MDHTEKIELIIQANMARKPKNIPKDQEWFWTEEWQRKEAEAELDIAEGRVHTYNSVEEMLKSLHKEQT